MKPKLSLFFVISIALTFFVNKTYSFEDLDVTFKGKVLKQTFVSLADDFGAIYYNPALMSKIRRREVGFYYNSIFNLGLIDHTFLGYVQPKLGKGTAGFGWSRLGTSANVEFMKYSENIFIFSYGQRVLRDIFVGGNVKYFFVDYDYKASGIGADLGLFIPTDIVNFGFLWQNFNQPEIYWQTGTKENLSSVIKFSVSKNFDDHIILFGLQYDEGMDLGLGWQWYINNNFAVIAGINSGKKENVSGSIGASFSMKNVKFSYGVELRNNLGLNNFLEINFKL